MGLCLASEKILPSLRNFFKIVYASYGFDYQPSPKPPTGDLEYLARQGVLLLNTALTVEDKQSVGKISHVDYWKPVTEAILTAVYQANPRCAFLAMGKPAREVLSAVENRLMPILSLDGRPKTFWYEKHPSAWIRQSVYQQLWILLMKSETT
jgi:uracil-DNA glycosylase